MRKINVSRFQSLLRHHELFPLEQRTEGINQIIQKYTILDQDTLLDQGATETKPHPPFHSYAKQARNRSQMPDSLLNNSTRLHKSSINEGRISAFKPLGPIHMPLLLANRDFSQLLPSTDL